MHFEPFIKNDEKSLENLEKQKQRDEMKLKLCEEHGIKMLYYSNVIHDGKYIGEIHYEKNIDESLLGVKMPSMILQPIVENCVNHGMREMAGEGRIKLSVCRGW